MDLAWFKERTAAIGAALDESNNTHPVTGKRIEREPTPVEAAAKDAVMDLAAVLLHDLHRIADAMSNQPGITLTQRVQPRERD